jgi:hypothetical protein
LKRRRLGAAVCDEIVAAAKDLSYFHRWQPTDSDHTASCAR